MLKKKNKLQLTNDNMQVMSDIEESYDSSYYPDSDVSTGIKSFNNEVPQEDNYQPSNATVNRLVNKFEEGLDEGQSGIGGNNTPRREGLCQN